MTMSTTYTPRLHYDLSEYYDTNGLRRKDLDLSDDSGYITISAVSDDGREVEIMTNSKGQGEFREVSPGNIRQFAGTCQFSLPYTAGGARKMLQRQWNEEYR